MAYRYPAQSTTPVAPRSRVGTGLASKPNTDANSSPASNTVFMGPVSAAPGASSISKNKAHSVGTMIRPTNSDDESVMIRVRGKNFMNSPTMPGQNVIGKNAANVVAVDAMIGQATSPVAIFAASFRSYPCSRKR